MGVTDGEVVDDAVAEGGVGQRPAVVGPRNERLTGEAGADLARAEALAPIGRLLHHGPPRVGEELGEVGVLEIEGAAGIDVQIHVGVEAAQAAHHPRLGEGLAAVG